MTQEEKQLLLKDLCARLPYGVKGCVEHYDESTGEACAMIGTFRGITYNNKIEFFYDSEYTDEEGAFNRFKIDLFRSYLRPMSSMTEDECVEFKWLNDKCNTMSTYEYVPINHYRIFDWLNRHHFDYRGLIEKGLVLEAPKDMYNFNNKEK